MRYSAKLTAPGSDIWDGAQAGEDMEIVAQQYPPPAPPPLQYETIQCLV